MNIDEILKALRSRSREEWLEFYREKWINTRIYVQEHGERAALAGFIIGLFLVLAFRLVVSLALLVLIAGLAVYLLADPKKS